MPRDDIDGESRKLSLVRHFLSEGGDYEENDDFIQYNGNNLGCSLFSMLPEFFEGESFQSCNNGDVLTSESRQYKPGC